MDTINNPPFLRFDFSINNKNSDPVCFINPVKIISTKYFDNVATCLDEIKCAVNNGYYVAGYMSYEAAYAFTHRMKDFPAVTMPLLWFGVFTQPTDLSKRETEDFSVGNWKLNQSKKEYEKAFQNIQQAIVAGETDQVNYTVQFQAPFSGSSLSYYEQLKHAQQGQYSAYLDLGNEQILSASPELFFHLQNNIITTKPMKGTIHRGKTYEEDIKNAKWLAASYKNQLENNLITKLMVDELKMVTNESSIKIIDQYQIKKYPTVYQMTSTIKGSILPHVSAVDILKTLFPCGSITGVPKDKTMDIIAKLEKNPRNVYCGTIGYIAPNNDAIFNVPIRTVMIDQKSQLARYGAGGGITRQSNVEEEFQETLTKTKVLYEKQKSFSLLETFGLKQGKIIAFEEHIQRIKNSANYFNIPIHIDSIKNQLHILQENNKDGEWRIRLLVNHQGKANFEVKPLPKSKKAVVKLASSPINKNDIFLYHKTTNRTVYEERLKEIDDVFDVLLWNENNEVTEFTIGNIVVERGDELLTPPIQCGLLPGTFREKLLKAGTIKESKITKEDLNHCKNIWLINSVREWVPVKLISE